FPEKVIDPVSLFFAERIADDAVQLARGIEIGPKRLFHNHSRPASLFGFVQAGGLEMFQDWLELVRRDCKIEKAITARPALLVDLVQSLRQSFETGFVGKVAWMV